MPRLLTPLLALLLGVWPARLTGRGGVLLRGRGRRLHAPGEADDAQDPVETPERARARVGNPHHWPGEVVFTTPERRLALRGRWRLAGPSSEGVSWHRATSAPPLDPDYPEAWETQLESLLTLQSPGARLQVISADTQGWREIELRAPTQPETVVQLDRAAVAKILDAADVRVELRVMG